MVSGLLDLLRNEENPLTNGGVGVGAVRNLVKESTALRYLAMFSYLKSSYTVTHKRKKQRTYFLIVCASNGYLY